MKKSLLLLPILIGLSFFSFGQNTPDSPDACGISASSTNETCPGSHDGSVTVQGTGGVAPWTYVWSNGAGNVATQNGLPSGNYGVTATDFTGCSASAVVVVGNASTFNPGVISNPASCGGASDDGSVLFTNLAPGTYTFTGTNSSGCVFTKTLIVGVATLPTALFTFVKDSTTFYFTNGSQNGTLYVWDFGDGTTSQEKNPVHTYSTSGTFNVKLITTNPCGSANFSQQVTVVITPPCVPPVLLYASPDVTIELPWQGTILSLETANPNDVVEWFPHIGPNDPQNGWLTFDYFVFAQDLPIGTKTFTWIVKSGAGSQCWITGHINVTVVDGSPTPATEPGAVIEERGPYPNPTSGEFRFDLSGQPEGSYQVIILTPSGQQLVRTVLKI